MTLTIGGQLITLVDPAGNYLVSVTKSKSKLPGLPTSPLDKLKNDLTSLANKIDPIQQELDALK